MIWIQFSSAPDAPPSTTFVGLKAEVWIKVLTDPPVEGIVVNGKIGLDGCPEESKEPLTFDGNGVARFRLEEDKHQEGKYMVEATAVKEGYHDATLSASFYYTKEEPGGIAEWGVDDLGFIIA